MWIEVLEGQEPKKWTFYKVGTGHEKPYNTGHMGTYFQDQFAWHIYGL